MKKKTPEKSLKGIECRKENGKGGKCLLAAGDKCKTCRFSTCYTAVAAAIFFQQKFPFCEVKNLLRESLIENYNLITHFFYNVSVYIYVK